MRTQLTPFPRYDASDRDVFYDLLGKIALLITSNEKPVLIDATANRRAYRDATRRSIARFAEVYVDTPLEVCAARDTKGLYRKGAALPGGRAPAEPPLPPELTVHGARGAPRDGAQAVMAWLQRSGWLGP